jgi:hypothetical protein
MTFIEQLENLNWSSIEFKKTLQGIFKLLQENNATVCELQCLSRLLNTFNAKNIEDLEFYGLSITIQYRRLKDKPFIYLYFSPETMTFGNITYKFSLDKLATL